VLKKDWTRSGGREVRRRPTWVSVWDWVDEEAVDLEGRRWGVRAWRPGKGEVEGVAPRERERRVFLPKNRLGGEGVSMRV